MKNNSQLAYRGEPVVLLSFDVEEFDIPLEYGEQISPQQQMLTGLAGTLQMESLLEKAGVSATLFTTAAFAVEYPDLIRRLGDKNEIASHSFYHSKFDQPDLLASKQKLAEISGRPITGFRMPRFQRIPLEWVKGAGYEYDSSINPTLMPGRYNNLRSPKTFYREDGLMRLPVSVTSRFRIPLFWLAFKNLPYPAYRRLALDALKTQGYLSLYFHPWELTDISRHNIPWYIKKDCGDIMSRNLTRLIGDLQNVAEFKTANHFLSGIL